MRHVSEIEQKHVVCITSVPTSALQLKRPSSRRTAASLLLTRKHVPDQQQDDRVVVDSNLEQPVIHRDRIDIAMTRPQRPPEPDRLDEVRAQEPRSTFVSVPWSPTAMRRAREVLRPAWRRPHDERPIRAERRATLVRSIALGRAWLDEVVSGRAAPAEIAAREGCSARRVSMLLSSAFLAPELVDAAVTGRLPSGIGTLLADPPLA